METKFNTLIVGAGVNGLASALMLAKRGEKVLVIDKGLPAKESTWAGSGIIAPLPPWRFNEQVNAIATRGMDLFDDFVAEIEAVSGLSAQYRRCGMVVTQSNPDIGVAWCAKYGQRGEARNLSEFSPHLTAASSVWMPDVATARNPRLAAALLTCCLKRGIEVRPHTPALSVLTAGGKVSGIATPAGVLQADNYVICAGAWSTRLLGPQMTGNMDVWPLRGQILLFRARPDVLPVIVLTEDQFYLVPRLDGLILAGTTRESVGFDKSVTEIARTSIHQRAGELLPLLRRLEPEVHWAGLRPASPEYLPTVGRHPEYANLWANAGHRAYGVTEAPSSAEHLASLMYGEKTFLDPAPFAWGAQDPAKPIL
ncbi:MAG: hypothetical protein RIR00_2625 [Pseudomonadota bacterium]